MKIDTIQPELSSKLKPSEIAVAHIAINTLMQRLIKAGVLKDNKLDRAQASVIYLKHEITKHDAVPLT